MRLNLHRAITLAEEKKDDLVWHDQSRPPQKADRKSLNGIGDVVLARKDILTSYHLSVVVDDGLQGITLVTRGEDLLYATPLHRLLQSLLGLPIPQWRHHGLILDKKGQRLAKRHNALSIQHYREEGATPEDVRSMAGFPSEGFPAL